MSNGYDPTTAAFYGGFVQIAYNMYIADPTNLTPSVPSTSPPLPDGYQIVAYINAVDHVLFDHVTRFFGFLAASTGDSPELVVAIRGTEGDIEWLMDFEFIPVTFKPVPHAGRVEDGFQKIYLTMTAVQPGGTGSQPLRQAIVSQLASSPASLVVAGHSLGAALANLLALDLVVNEQLSPALWTLASPRTGDAHWVRFFDSAFSSAGLTSWRVYNEPDVIPRLPPLYAQVDTGEEVDSKTSKQIKQSIGCYHSLRTYLHMLDPSNPFGILPQCVPGTGATPLGTVV